jgi:hypothetical protein
MRVERRRGRSCRGRLVRLSALGAAAGLVASAFPAVAGATDYCVAPNTGCGPTNVATFQQALDLAAAGADADRIFLGAATYTAPTASGFAYDQPSRPVEIVGAGRGGPTRSVVMSPSGATGRALLLRGGPGTSIHDLRIQLPQNVAPALIGLQTNGTAREITVAMDPAQTNPSTGVVLTGGVLEDSLVGFGLQNTEGVIFDNGGGPSGIRRWRQARASSAATAV